MRDCAPSSDESEGHQHLDVSRYENSFYLLWVLERLLPGGGGAGGGGAGAIGGGAGAGLGGQLGQLERRALQLSDEFPLFALYAWRVTTCPSPTVTAQTPDPR
ncbi:hypothetical protein AAFF_G00120580 [Aldrovandia affinis]|uniref:Uncharacterized protein n=1 Tax=Aldrovandia affinis TaxID=143900 RepID=A0AAD7RSF2_9TELE|nr:hypothetical protein AAFF_G00120580 [Aldrovandia affinis]